MKHSDLIEIRETASGKTAFVGRTRIHVANIMVAYQLQMDEMVIDRICAEYPQLTREHVYAALEYGREHSDEIERELAENEAALARLADR